MSKRIVVGVSDLKSTHPELYAELHDPTSVPATISFGSNIPVDWTCSLGHVWSARPNDRSKGKGCPYCSGRLILPGFNDLRSVAPAVADRLYDQRLGQTLQLNSNKVVDWLCVLGHKFSARVPDVAKGGEFGGCSYCSGKKILIGFNDLGSQYPEVASELDDPNYTPQGLAKKSNKSVWWVCSRGHRWYATVCDRTTGNGCKICSTTNTSKVEQEIYRRIVDSQPDIMVSNGKLLRVSWEGRSRVYPDILIASEHFTAVIEYDGEYWHRGKVVKDTFTTEKLLEDGYWVARVRESCRSRSLPNLDLNHNRLLQITHDFDVTSVESTANALASWLEGIKEQMKSHKETL